MKSIRKSILRPLLLLLLALAVTSTAYAITGGALWPFGGHDLSNTRYAKTESAISPATVGDLTVKWVVETGGDVSATPAVDESAVYVPDWAGNLFKIDRETGEVLWQRAVGDYTGIPGDFARTTPAVHDGMLIFGDQGGRLFQGAKVMAVDRESGDPLWVTQVDTHPTAIVTQSAVVFDGVVYVGVASFEELFAAIIPGYECCTFRGNIVALDAATGQILWRTYTAPEGYSGNAVWGPTPVVDPKRKSLYITTGNNYTVPDDVLACVAANDGDPDAIAACLPADNFFDSIMALDLKTGAVKWATKALPFDSWTVACLFGPEENCTSPTGPDLDFGEGPALFKTRLNGGKPLELLGAGQKSGQYWALNPDTGQVVWVTQVGPGGLLGGMIWGSAVDGERVYVANANSGFELWTLVGGQQTTGGFWSALDAATGEILWQTANPIPTMAEGAVTAANGVVFGCSLDTSGNMYALDAATGAILWNFASGGSCNAGPAVVNGMVYWGSGYSALADFGATGNDKFYAFSLSE